MGSGDAGRVTGPFGQHTAVSGRRGDIAELQL